MRSQDKQAMLDIQRKLDAATVAMARVFVDSGAPDVLREFVKGQWLEIAKVQVALEEWGSPSEGTERKDNDNG